MATLDNILNAQEKKQSVKNFSVQMIHYSKLEPSEHNKYSVDQIEELANMLILSGGVKQNLLARKKTPDTYTIIAGHRRREAARYLVEECGLEQFALVPVHVESADETITRLELILTNAGCRVRSDFEKMEEVNDLYVLLTALRDGSDQDKDILKLMTGMAPEEIGGRELRAIVAEKLGMGETKVANLRHIEAKLSPELKEKFKEGEIGISVANEAAGLPPEKQKELETRDSIKLSEVKGMKTVSESDTEVQMPKSAVEESEPVSASRFPKECITGLSPYGNCVCCGFNGVTCCQGCDEKCNSQCGWLEYSAEKTQDEQTNVEVEEDQEEIGCIYYDAPVECPIGPACEEICCEDCLSEECEKRCRLAKYPICLGTPPWEKTKDISEEGYESELYEEDSIEHGTEVFDLDVLHKLINDAKFELETMEEYWIQNQPKTYAKKHMQIEAYEMLLKYYEQVDSEPVKQPDLPNLKNNDQRKDWIQNYKEWPVWFEVPEASETYYRYDFEDGTSFVICEYRYYAEWMNAFSVGDPERTGNREYILKPDYRYLHNCRSNMTAMIDYLKEVQKKC